MAERTARLGSMFYRAEDGRYRIATGGDKIKVHPDYLERFDRLNVLPGDEPAKADEEPEEKPAPRRRGRPRKAE